MRGFRAALLSCAALAAGCDDNRCGHPDELTYDCAPVPLGTANSCSGGPTWEGVHADPDKAYPLGCVASYPFCAAYYPDEVQTCSCTDFGGSGSPTWACPI
ncbi:MAG TPA: hypothetical protein VFV99_31750 [Kofleriaceae bacterium]|nr:hypothetical protein [Kofleriaceae bacterium]